MVAAAWLLGAAGSAAAADAGYLQDQTAKAAESGFYVRGDVGWFWANRDGDSDGAGTLGVGIGYQWSDMFRTDLQAEFLNLVPDWDDGGRAIFTTMVNAYVDLPLDSVVKPYVGGGVGYGFVNIDSGHDRDGLATALTGGITFDVTSIVAVDVGYRYRRLWGDPQLDDHQVTAGLRFNF